MELTKRMKKTTLPLKARDKLLVGKSGSIKVVWKRGKESRTTPLTKAPSQMPILADSDGSIQLLFTEGVDRELASAIEGKSNLVIDLRNNANGLYGPMKKSLELLVPSGKYGSLAMANRKAPLEIVDGAERPIQVRLLVDKSTRGAAEVFANVLVQAGVGKIQGGPSAGHPVLVEDFPLPDGSGYTLAVAKFGVEGK
jgi:C-terminal processing protease CtpA/Prc